MNTKKTLEITLLDENEKSLKFSISDPKDSIDKSSLVNFEQSVVDNNVFVGSTGAIVGFGSAYFREVSIVDLLK